MTPDNIKYGHTPTGPEVIAGVTLKDAKRASKWPAYVDVAQSVTGAILGIFLFEKVLLKWNTFRRFFERYSQYIQ